jgi:hypothetical protein
VLSEDLFDELLCLVEFFERFDLFSFLLVRDALVEEKLDLGLRLLDPFCFC